MPKLKSHSGAKKRFKVTASGKVKFNHSGKGHFLTEKSKDRKRGLRQGAYIEGAQAKTLKKMIQG